MITKRQLGYFFMAAGLLIIAGAVGANFIGGREAGFGPFQALGIGGGVVIIVMAIPLIKLGNRPA
jgi:hypothetical protein